MRVKTTLVAIKVNGWILEFCQPHRSLPDDQTVISQINFNFFSYKKLLKSIQKANAKTNLKLTREMTNICFEDLVPTILPLLKRHIRLKHDVSSTLISNLCIFKR